MAEQLEMKVKLDRSAGRPKKMTPAQEEHALSLVALGVPDTQIAKAMNVCRSTVFNLRKRTESADTEGSVARADLKDYQAAERAIKAVYGGEYLISVNLEDLADIPAVVKTCGHWWTLQCCLRANSQLWCNYTRPK